MRYITDRKRVQGLGSGREGTHHHWQMMITSTLMVILVPLFVITFTYGFGAAHEDVVSYFGRPFPAIVTILTLVVVVFHLMNEALAAVEDYVHGLAGKLTLIGVTAFSYTLIAVGIFSIARMAL